MGIRPDLLPDESHPRTVSSSDEEVRFLPTSLFYPGLNDDRSLELQYANTLFLARLGGISFPITLGSR